MSRLYDRVMAHGCRPLTGGDIHAEGSRHNPVAAREFLRGEILNRLERELTDAELDRFDAQMKRDLSRFASSLTFDKTDAEGAVVVSAEEVADHWATLPEPTNILDVVASVAPPFERIFVEVQKRWNPQRFDSWGVLIQGDRTDAGWTVIASLVGEWRKGEPVGPIVRWVVPLDDAGRMRPNREDGLGSLFAEPHGIASVPIEAQLEFVDELIGFVGIALFSISLMHCKNVDIRPVDPPERVARKYERKHGRPLTRYYVLDVQSMRHVLDTEGEARTRGLKHALHICRGHFKTFTEDAPLFGKHTGTYWWESQARGKAEHGVVEKDYRIRLDQGLGREYVEVDEHAEITPTAPEHTGLDPDLGGRGLKAHNITQNLLAAAVQEAGFEPRRPKPSEPQYDLAWEAGDVTWVAEVKSITPQNEERQLRLGLGQVLRYRQLLWDEGRQLRAMIMTEREPVDSTWRELCATEDILLGWPGNLAIV